LLDSSKIKNDLGWEAKIDFEQGLKETINWYANNRQWWENIKDGSYKDYYDSYYKGLEG
jgi:dTDP-glucose 4,6-dehydratase